jgi:hypothetical protein
MVPGVAVTHVSKQNFLLLLRVSFLGRLPAEHGDSPQKSVLREPRRLGDWKGVVGFAGRRRSRYSFFPVPKVKPLTHVSGYRRIFL